MTDGSSNTVAVKDRNEYSYRNDGPATSGTSAGGTAGSNQTLAFSPDGKALASRTGSPPTSGSEAGKEGSSGKPVGTYFKPVDQTAATPDDSKTESKSEAKPAALDRGGESNRAGQAPGAKPGAFRG